MMTEPTSEAIELQRTVDTLRATLAQSIVGQEAMVDMLIIALLADGHVLLEGVPGVAKTITARLVAATVDCTFSRVQFTPDLMPADIIGTSVFHPRDGVFEFRRGPVFANIVLTDEINRAPAKTQSALFEVMEERQITVDGTTHVLERPFMVLATQNPIEQEGTYRLPEAQLDRFLFKISVPYPTLEQETDILRRFHTSGGRIDVSALRPILDRTSLQRYRALVRTVTVEDSLLQYVARIVQSTRSHQALYLGASPRASLGIIAAAKASAMMAGRGFMIPDDIQAVAPAVLRHRIQLQPEREIEGLTADSVVRTILAATDVPR